MRRLGKVKPLHGVNKMDPRYLDVQLRKEMSIVHERDATDTMALKEMENSGWYGRLKAKTFRIFDQPSSSGFATMMSWLIMTCIFVSTLALLLETLPELEGYKSMWFHLELFFVSIFVTEYCCRLWSTPNSFWRFFCEPLNMVDFLAVLPFFIEVIVTIVAAGLDMPINLRFLRVVRLFRLVRLCKLARYAKSMLLIKHAMAESVEGLVIIFSFLSVAMVIFGALMVLAERGEWDEVKVCYARMPEPYASGCSPFQSIPESFYWGITTLTSVGYGDAFPTSNLGKAITGVAMVGGVLTLCLPIILIGLQFGERLVYIQSEIQATKSQMETASVDAEPLTDSLYEAIGDLDDMRLKAAKLLPALQARVIATMVSDEQYKDENECLAALSPHFDIVQRRLLDSIEDLRTFVCKVDTHSLDVLRTTPRFLRGS